MRWLALVAAVAGCHAPAQRRSLTASPEVCRAARPFCLPAHDMERILFEAPLLVRAAEAVGSGRTGSVRLLVEIPPVVRLKWKVSGPDGDGYNRSPRRELAAYALQKLFLDEDDFVVPPTAVRCQPPAWARLAGGDAPVLDGTGCVLGVLSYWVEDARQLEPFSRERFARDRGYRRRIALFNLVTYLIDHHDIKPANFIVSRDARAFSVDNGMSFSGWRTPWGWFAFGWQDLVVDALPRETLARLKRLTRRDLDVLATVAELRVRRGLLEPVAAEPPFDEHRGVRRRGDRIQLGLTWDEIEGVAERLQALLQRVEGGEIESF